MKHHARTAMALAFAVLCLSGPAHGAAGSANMLGPGSAKCADWLGERENNPGSHAAGQAWILGYISAANVVTLRTGLTNGDIGNGESDLVLANRALEYCDTHPNALLSEAGENVAAQLLYAPGVQSPGIQTPSDGTSIWDYLATLGQGVAQSEAVPLNRSADGVDFNGTSRAVPRANTCMYKRTEVSGMNRLCMYDCAGSTAVTTIDRTRVCPIRAD